MPLMQSPENTTHMAAQLNAKLSLELAPRTTVHGVFDGDLRRGCAAYRGFRRRQK
ncbi:MAG: hypothetical protein ACLTY5_08575 [Angelakisella sp.]